MFSSTELQVVKDIVNTAYKEGYAYYVAYTHTTINSGYYDTAQPDLYIIVSKDEITGSTAYSYTCSENSIIYTCRTGNYSSYNGAVNTDRIVTDDYLAESIVIPVYEHVYTNANFGSYSLQPDIIPEGGYRDVQLGSQNVLIAAFLLVFCFFKMWQIHK